MKNSEARAFKWVEFVAFRPEFPQGSRLLAAFRAGSITRICDCGCNSFDIEVPAAAGVIPLAASGRYGGIFRFEFHTQADGGDLAFRLYADESGHLAGLDVEYRGNSFPVPSEPLLVEPPYNVFASTRLGT